MSVAQGLFITGTDTGVGKTLVTAILAAIVSKRGFDCGLFKPVQSGVRQGFGPDLAVYRRFTLLSDSGELMVPVRLRAPQAPLIAARMEKRKVQIEKMAESFYILSNRHRNMLIEGAGGLIVPVTPDIQVIDLIRKFSLPALIVARPTLGTINHTCLTAAYLRAQGITAAGVIFSNVLPKELPLFRKVAGEISRLSHLSMLGYLEKYDFRRLTPEQIVRKAEKTLSVNKLLSFFKK